MTEQYSFLPSGEWEGFYNAPRGSQPKAYTD
jgi:hypothetical protein